MQATNQMLWRGGGSGLSASACTSRIQKPCQAMHWSVWYHCPNVGASCFCMVRRGREFSSQHEFCADGIDGDGEDSVTLSLHILGVELAAKVGERTDSAMARHVVYVCTPGAAVSDESASLTLEALGSWYVGGGWG